MRKSEIVMNLIIGVAMSLAMSLLGVVRSGRFSLAMWLIPFCISFFISMVIGTLVPYKTLINDVCTSKKIRSTSFKGVLLGSLIIDVVYTPLMSSMMGAAMHWYNSRNLPVGAMPPIYIMLPTSVLSSFAVGFVLIALLIVPATKISDKVGKKYGEEEKQSRGRLIYITTVLIVMSFAISTVISIISTEKVINSENKNMAKLMADNLYDEISMELQEHIAIGRIIAGNPELINLIKEEDKYSREEMEGILKDKLSAYSKQYGCNLAFLVFDKSGAYYSQDGFNKNIDVVNDEHDLWYSDFLSTNSEYRCDIDIDETHSNIWTVFVNVRIVDENGKLLGVCGIGTQIADMQEFFAQIQDEYGVKICIIDNTGVIQVDNNGINIGQALHNIEMSEQMGRAEEDGTVYVENGNGYVIFKPVEKLGWSILIQRNMNSFKVLMEILSKNLIVMVVVFAIFIVIASLLLRRSSSIMTKNIQLESYETLRNMFDGVYLIDINTRKVKEIKNLLVDGRHLFSDDELYMQKNTVLDTWIDEGSKDAFEIVFEEDKYEEKYANRSSQSVQFIMNEIGWCRANLVAVRDRKSKKIDHMILAIEIIEEEVRRQNEMREETEAAKFASEAKGRFLANMSHEIRTPINAVLGMDTMILRESNEPQIKEYALNIQSAGNTLLSLINDILDFSKIESGKMEIVPVEYDFSSLINDVKNMVQTKANTKGLSLDIILDENLPSALYGDDIRIRQVILNIMNNAVKYTEKGGIVFSVSGKIIDEKVKLLFSIKDTGIGIKEEDMNKLFSDFERIEESRNRSIEGTGLGMSITTQLLELMGSKLKVESVYGKGSNFYFELEQEIRNYEPIGDFSKRVSEKSDSFEYEVSFVAPDARVLVVDDNAMNRLVFRKLLKETEVQIDEADCGRAGINKVLTNEYDIIFLDHMMPDMDGIEVMQEIKKIAAQELINVDTPVFALTANAISGAREKYLEAGFTDYLSKPIIPDKLEKAIAKYIPDDKKSDCKKKKKTASDASFTQNYPTIEGLDWNYAELHLTSEEMLIDTLKGFFYSIDFESEQLEKLYDKITLDRSDKEAVDSFRIKIHALKSSANLVGIVPVSGMAAMLEYAARAEDVNYLVDVIPHFLDSLKEYKEKLSEFVYTFVAKDKETISDKGEIVGYLKRLKEAAENFEVNDLDATLENISSYKYDAEVEEILGKLKGAVNNLDVENIVSLAERMLDKL